MLNQVIKDPAARQRLREGVLGAHLDTFTTALAKQGYAPTTVLTQVWALAALDRWLVREHLPVARLDEPRLEAFLEERRRQGPERRNDRSAVRHLLAHLRDEGVLAQPNEDSPRTDLTHLLERYEQHLHQNRGVVVATTKNYTPFARRFLVEHFGDGPLRLEELTSPDVSRFLLQHAHSISPGRAKVMVTALRSFFRFLLQHGAIERDLAASVPSVANWRLATVPRHISSEEIRQILEACDQGTATGRRDYAILLLLARLGLRGGEVVGLVLDDLDWRRGELVVSGKGRRRDRLPLPSDVGDALVRYLRQDRPESASRRFFLRLRAPYRGLAGPSSLSAIVQRALVRAEIDAPTKGAHLLRHSLATAMLGQGASIAEIGEVLRHQAASTTEIYAKVDFRGLGSLAQPWPVRGGAR